MATPKRNTPRRQPRRGQGSCGGKPRRNGSGGGTGNSGTRRQPRKR